MTKKPTPKPKGINPSDVRGRSPRALSQTINKLTKSMLGRQGLTQGSIIAKWHDIIGEDLARHTSPQKIVFARDGVSGGTLHLRCDSGALATQLQHTTPQILDRVNTFFGYQAVLKLRLIQGPLPGHVEPRKKPVRPLSKAQADAIAGTVASVEDDELRAALERLGSSIVSRDHRKA